MKKLIIITIIITLTLILTLAGTGCDKEQAAEDRSSQEGSTVQEAEKDEKASEAEKTMEAPEYRLLYQLSGHDVSSFKAGNITCYSLNFREFLDGGIIMPDGSGNKILDLKDYPTSLITSGQYDDYYYISSQEYPVSKIQGYSVFNWDVGNQTIYIADYSTSSDKEVASSTDSRFPGDVLASPYNKYLVYLMTSKGGSNASSGTGYTENKFNPFISDSDLVVRNLNSGEEKNVLQNNYNRQLATSFSDFSDSGEYFYTISIDGNIFEFIRVTLETGGISSFTEVFSYFNWSKINWSEFFPKTGDMAYACFSIDPEEERLVAYKNYFTADLSNPCYTESTHRLWVFNLEDGSTEVFDNQAGYVSDITWEPDGQKFALSVISHCGCYPDYLDSRIDIMDKNGKDKKTLLTEQKSKITNIGWSPDGEIIAYDVYGTDYIGRLKLIDVESKKVSELIDTLTMEGLVDTANPDLILFIDWVEE
jgi:Tol biopolymer transport system component